MLILLKFMEIENINIMFVQDVKVYIKYRDEIMIPKCNICGKEMINTTDRITGKMSKYLWKFDCECNEYYKTMTLSIG